MLILASVAPQVDGFGPKQWQAFLEIYQAQEQHVLHLVQPVWDSPEVGFRVLLQKVEATVEGAGGTGSGDQVGGSLIPCYAELLRWVRAPLMRCCFHSTVSVRRLGLAGLLGFGPGNDGQGVIRALIQVREPYLALSFTSWNTYIHPHCSQKFAFCPTH